MDFSLRIEVARSHVPHKSPDHVHAAYMPDATQAVNRLRLGLYPGARENLPRFGRHSCFLSTLHQRFTCVRLRGPYLTQSCCAFSLPLTTTTLCWPQQRKVVWDLPLQAGPEGPTLISCAAWLLHFGLLASFQRPSCRNSRESVIHRMVRLRNTSANRHEQPIPAPSKAACRDPSPGPSTRAGHSA